MRKVTAQIFRDYGLTVVIAIGIAWLLRIFVLEAFRIPNNTMQPGLLTGDLIFVDKIHAQVMKDFMPKRGEIIVFSNSAAPGGISLSFIRRVIALPGDEITIHQGLVRLKMKGQSEAGLLSGSGCNPTQKSAPTSCAEQLSNDHTYAITLNPPVIENVGPTLIPDHALFVIADNRSQLDNKARKSWGLIPIASVQGTARWIWLSIGGPSGIRWHRMFKRIE